jgi:Domain of unknown function (DUF4398)
MSRPWILPIPMLLAAALSVGCASAPARPTAEFARAQTLVEQAERNRAQQYAAADLDRARDKLRRSDVAMNAHEEELANRLAAEAAIDAEVALARSSTAQAENSAAEVTASVEALRRESQRDVGNP